MNARLSPHNARIVRVIWLAALAIRSGGFTREMYDRRWALSQRSFMRDLTTLRVTGICVDYDREYNRYELLEFDPAFDVANGNRSGLREMSIWQPTRRR